MLTPFEARSAVDSIEHKVYIQKNNKKPPAFLVNNGVSPSCAVFLFP